MCGGDGAGIGHLTRTDLRPFPQRDMWRDFHNPHRAILLCDFIVVTCLPSPIFLKRAEIAERKSYCAESTITLFRLISMSRYDPPFTPTSASVLMSTKEAFWIEISRG